MLERYKRTQRHTKKERSEAGYDRRRLRDNGPDEHPHCVTSTTFIDHPNLSTLPLIDKPRIEQSYRLSPLVHELDHSVDVSLPVTSVTSLDEVGELLALETTVGVRELEGPEELVGVLEVGSSSGNLVDQVLNRDDTVLSEVLFDDGVGVQGESLSVDLGVSSLVDQVSDGSNRWFTVSDVRLDELEHLLGGLGELDENTVVDLDQSQELQNLSRLGGDVVDTTETNDQGNLGLGGDVEVTSSSGSSTKPDLLSLSELVLLDVLLGSLEDDLSLA